MVPLPPPRLVLPSLDFETSSEAGYVWNATTNKWGCLPHASQGKKGLKVVGAAVYAEHPSTRVLTASYDLLDGQGVRRWQPTRPNPQDLFDYLAHGGLLGGWNTAFEQWIWNKVCVRLYDWPVLNPAQLRCTMARARAHCLPGTLGAAAEVLGLAQQKNKEGTRLINKFSVPRNPTKTDPRVWIHPEEDPEDAENLYQYCDEDVRAEAAAAAEIPELSEAETEYWLVDQQINRRGVRIDVAGMENCIAIIDQVHAESDAQLPEVTQGAVEKTSQVARITAWLHTQGVHTDSLDEEHIDALLKTELPDVARKVLQIRQVTGSAAVKKAYAMRNTLTQSGRLYDLFTYHASRTGRSTGNGVQPANLPNSGPEVYECKGCGAFFGTHHGKCPECFTSRPPESEKQEWSHRAAEFALYLAGGRSLQLLQYYFGDAMAAISGCLRGLFIASPGHDFIGSDYNSIEAVGLAELAGEEWRREVFRTHGKIYEMSASKISGVPFEEFMIHAGYSLTQLSQPKWWEQKPENKGKHHPLRKTIGKVSELACFTRDTQVLTDRGYQRIVDVRLTDKVWDGLAWTSHGGVIWKGKRPVIDLDGVKMTPSHPISIGRLWKEARELAFNENMLSQALVHASENLPYDESILQNRAVFAQFGSSVPAEEKNTLSPPKTSSEASPPGVMLAQNEKALIPRFVRNIRNFISHMNMPCPIQNTVADYLTVFLRRLTVATALRIGAFRITEGAASRCAMNGVKTGDLSFSTLSLLRGGMTRREKWTESTSTGITLPEIFDLSPSWKTTETVETCLNFKNESPNWKDVYDIVNAGPLHRFTIKTDSGHLIVHNSGYQGWIGAWTNFGADEFMNDDQMKDAILAWRAASPAIVEFWGGQERRVTGANGRWHYVQEYFGVEGMTIQAILSPGHTFSFRDFQFVVRKDVLYVRLPSGRELAYHRPRLGPGRYDRGYSISYEGWNTNPKNGPTGWIRMSTWGGKFTENFVQAACRDLLMPALIRLSRAGYLPVLHVYDEAVVEVPEGFGSVEEMERMMMVPTPWSAKWPVRASGGWRGKRFRK